MKKLYTLLFLPVILIGAQRKVLIEVYTATWCSFCPYSSYALDTLEMNYGDSIAVIKYHPSNSDPFHTSEAVIRANYYPDLTGYPTAYFDGIISVGGGWNGVYSEYRNAFLSRIDSTSPVTISITPEYNSPSRNGRCIISVYAEQKLSDNEHLRFAIVEDSIHYHWQSRDILRYVLRRMLPDANGIPLSLNAGDSLIDTINFSLENDWFEPYIYFVAFVQNDNTKEVLQSEIVRLPIDYGYLKLVNNWYSDSIGNGNNRLEPVDSAIYFFTITNIPPYNTATDINIHLYSSDTFLHFNASSFHFDSLQVNDTITFFTKIISSGGPSRMSELYLEMESDSGRFHIVDTLYLKVGFDSLLVWDATENKMLKDYVLPYLDDLQVTYDFYSETDSGIPDLYPEYKYLIYFSGNKTPTSSDIERLKDYMDEGISAFITGQNIAKSQDSIFLTHYLKVRFLYDTTLDLLTKGAGFIFNPEDTIFLTGQGSAMNQSSKDVIEPLPGTIPILYYRKYGNVSDTDTAAAVAYDDGSKKVVFFAFGYEGTGELKIGKKEVLRRVLNYLGYSISGIEEKGLSFSHTPERVIFLSSSIMRVPLKYNGKKYVIYDPAGARQCEGKVKDGIIRLPSYMKNGIYFLKIQNDTQSVVRRLLLVK